MKMLCFTQANSTILKFEFLPFILFIKAVVLLKSTRFLQKEMLSASSCCGYHSSSTQWLEQHRLIITWFRVHYALRCQQQFLFTLQVGFLVSRNNSLLGSWPHLLSLPHCQTFAHGTFFFSSYEDPWDYFGPIRLLQEPPHCKVFNLIAFAKTFLPRVVTHFKVMCL